MRLAKGIKPSEIFTLRVGSTANPVLWHYDFLKTPFGKLIVAGELPSVSYVAFYENEKAALELLHKRNENISVKFDRGCFEQIAKLLTGAKIRSKIILTIAGTSFQEKVWNQLLDIPFGEYVSYGEIAKAIGRPGASRAIGTAVGKNPIAYFVPCHRVLASGGGIGGYYWGVELKRKIIKWERELVIGH